MPPQATVQSSVLATYRDDRHGAINASCRPWCLRCLIALLSLPLRAQDESRAGAGRHRRGRGLVYANSIAGEFRPAKGFDIVQDASGPA